MVSVLSAIRKANTLSNEKPWLVFTFFVAFAIFLRLSSFYQSVVDWDESLYILVARAWLEGNPPYTAVWDNKPPGIYAIFAIAISILGNSIFSIRILTCLFVALTCFFLYKTGNLLDPHGKKIGLLAGSLYAVSTLSNGGLASNTEIFFTTFVAIAFYYFLALCNSKDLFSNSHLKLFLIGLLLGIGFEIKYVVIFDFLALIAVLAFTFILQFKSSRKYWLVLQAAVFLSIGFVLPFMMVSFYFWMIGHFDDYIYANFTANKLRTVYLGFSPSGLAKDILKQIEASKFFWLSIPSTVIYLIISKNKTPRERWLISSFIIWFFTILLGICLVFRGPLYAHYFLQLSPPLCFITAYLLTNLIFSGTRKTGRIEFRRYFVLSALLIVLFITTEAFNVFVANAKYAYFTHVKGNRHWEDAPALIADYLEPRLNSDDYIYMVDDAPIVYFLTGAKIPTRYAFPPFLLLRTDLPNITGVAPLEELDRILQKQPVYIIKRQVDENPKYVSENKIFLNQLDQYLSQNYRRETSIKGLDLYRLNTQP